VIFAFAKVRKQRKKGRYERCRTKGRKKGTKGKGGMKSLLPVDVAPSSSLPFGLSGVALLGLLGLYTGGGGPGDLAASDVP
jgi:hypothetical protein